MKKFLVFLTLLLLVVGATSAYAIPLGTSITIWDKVTSGTVPNWYNRGSGPGEDQEVEPNCVTGQQWDLEGFFMNGIILTMVGGYDFANGVEGLQSGDIFIDTDGDAKYGPGTGGGSGNSLVPNTFGYDYVLDLDFITKTYSVYSIGSSTYLINVLYAQNAGSNPWRYSSGGTAVSGWENKPFINYWSGLSDSQVGGLLGGNHYATGVDLSFLPHGSTFTSHFTMQCGNDNLMGQGSIPTPEPATMFLLGSGLIGLAGFARKKFSKK